MHTYLDGRKDTFDIMHEHCRNGHQVQSFEDRTKWFTSCFLLETKKFDEVLWKCCYDRCPLLKNKYNVTIDKPVQTQLNIKGEKKSLNYSPKEQTFTIENAIYIDTKED